MNRINAPPLRLNNPWEGFVKVGALLESGKLRLHLRNDHHRSISVTRLSLYVLREKKPISLLEKPINLLPADSRYLEIGDILKPFFNQISEGQERLITVRLAVEPELSDQPEQFRFRIRYGKGRFLDHCSVPSVSEKD